MGNQERKTDNNKLKKLKEKYASDSEFREEHRRVNRERYHNDPVYKEKTLQRAKSRYHTDPEYRKATIERAKARHLRNKKDKES